MPVILQHWTFRSDLLVNDPIFGESWPGKFLDRNLFVFCTRVCITIWCCPASSSFCWKVLQLALTLFTRLGLIITMGLKKLSEWLRRVKQWGEPYRFFWYLGSSLVERISTVCGSSSDWFLIILTPRSGEKIYNLIESFQGQGIFNLIESFVIGVVKFTVIRYWETCIIGN